MSVSKELAHEFIVGTWNGYRVSHLKWFTGWIGGLKSSNLPCYKERWKQLEPEASCSDLEDNDFFSGAP